MDAKPRYAIYFTPPIDDALTKSAATWLGWDIHRGVSLSHPILEGFDNDAIAALTIKPRHYGFHGTLKAPFTLSETESVESLRAGFRTFCAQSAGFFLPEMRVAPLGSFLALQPQTRSSALNVLAWECVTFFDRYRAELTEEDILKRRPETLSKRQKDYLMQWGYPFIGEDFRFHMTLTGPLEDEKRTALQTLLQDYFAASLSMPFKIGQLALVIEAKRRAPFVVLETCDLAGIEKQEQNK